MLALAKCPGGRQTEGLFGRGQDDLGSGSKTPRLARKTVLWHQEKHPGELKWAKFMACCCHPAIWADGWGIAYPPEGTWLLQPPHPLMAGQCWLRVWQMPLPGWSESQLRGFQVFISSAGFMLELPADCRVSLPLTVLRIPLSFPMTWFLQLHPQHVGPLGCPSWLPPCGCACRAASQRAAQEGLGVRDAIRQRGSPCERGRDAHRPPSQGTGKM